MRGGCILAARHAYSAALVCGHAACYHSVCPAANASIAAPCNLSTSCWFLFATCTAQQNSRWLPVSVGSVSFTRLDENAEVRHLGGIQIR